MKEVEKFIKENTKYQKGSFVTSKTLYFTFKSLTKNKITKKNFKEYCDEHLTVKSDFWGIDRKNKKKKVRSAYEVEFKIENKWRSEYTVKEKRLKRKQVEGFFCNVHNMNECILVDKNGEVMHFNYYYNNDSRRKINDCFLKKVSITYYEKDKYKNISEMKKIDFHKLNLNDRNLVRNMRNFYTRKYSILGRVLFGKVEKIEDLTSEEKEMLSVG